MIAIIAILAAMLLPALGKVKEAGKRASCSSTLKQLGGCSAMYVADYKDYLCAYWGLDTKWWWAKDRVVSYAYPQFNAQARKIETFYKATKFLHCPSDTNSYGVAYGDSYNITTEPMSYGWNECMGNQNFHNPAQGRTNLTYSPKQMKQVKHPSMAILAADISSDLLLTTTNPFAGIGFPNGFSRVFRVGDPIVSNRHGRNFNVARADGSSGSESLTYMLSLNGKYAISDRYMGVK